MKRDKCRHKRKTDSKTRENKNRQNLKTDSNGGNIQKEEKEDKETRQRQTQGQEENRQKHKMIQWQQTYNRYTQEGGGWKTQAQETSRQK